jgi:hypothetical protein
MEFCVIDKKYVSRKIDLLQIELSTFRIFSILELPEPSTDL